ncbi:MAG: hypothetical protein H6R22_1509, partial [Chromatiaceae bacterium]|nr:hypothetical protein [Chromatiaceae bacterium]
MRPIIRRSWFPFFWLALLVAPGLPAWAAAPPAVTDSLVPETLRPWIPWVLEREDHRGCPLDPAAVGKPAGVAGTAGTAAAPRLCAWPGRLYLDLDGRGGLFAQSWEVYAESWVPLPGDAEIWPQDTRSDDTPVAVVQHDGAPAVKLAPGTHAISGRFAWSSPPEGLTVPAETGLLSLVIDGVEVPVPRVERGGRLWIGDPKAAGTGEEEDRLGIEVFRQIDDALPLRVTTRLKLDVAGRARVLSIGPALLPGGVPLRLQSPVPARLDQDGTLQLQVRPGSWVVELEAHHPGDVTELGRPAAEPPWPELEVWSFAARPDLRRVEVKGLRAVDPLQSGVPADWSRLPAYRVGPGETMTLELRQRGDPDPGPSRLDLNRDLWLDFDGVGYSVRDRIDGQLTRGWRLDLWPPLTLGQVQVDGEPRLITRLAHGDPPGVEVRRGRLQLTADSRLEEATAQLPVSGWGVELGSIRARLHLPPGWDLLAVSGVDNLPASWLARWTLLDLFLVLILALGWYFRLSLLALLVVGLPFLAGQVRNGLWPQLERPWAGLGGAAGVGAPTAMDEGLSLGAVMRDSAEMVARDKLKSSLGKPAAAPPPLDSLDPGARVQSGPGMPDWGWSAFDLAWNGPVQPDETVRLWLLTPFWHLVWALGGAVLVVLLGLRVAGLFLTGGPGGRAPESRPEPIDDLSLDLSDPPLGPGVLSRSWVLLA